MSQPRIVVYLIYPDHDPQIKTYLQAIQETSIIPIPCCNNKDKNLLRHNSSGLRIDRLPTFVCRRDKQRWLLSWDQLELAKQLSLSDQ